MGYVLIGIGAAMFFIAVIVVVTIERDRKRMVRAQIAGWEAMMQTMMEEPPVPVRLVVRINDWGEERGENRWRWTVWDPDFDYDSSRVEGGLVPYALGNAARRSEAVGEALASIKEWAHDTEWEGTVTIIDEEPDNPSGIVESGTL